MSTGIAQSEQAIENLRDSVQDRLDTDNPEAVPQLEKIVINVGLGEARNNVTELETVQDQLARISGQQPVVTRARKSVASFGIREGDPVGVKVTLRGDRMYDFFRKLIHVALPRSRDFSGLDPDSMDQAGNYSLGIDEQVIFPEISAEEVGETTTFGMDVTIVTTTNSNEEARVLLEEYGMPLAGLNE